MKRTQIYLEEELDERLRAAAASEGRSAADLIREALRALLASRRPRGRDPFLEIAGAFSGGAKDASIRHDDLLYRQPGGASRAPRGR